jgi:hypothetical protein
MIKPEKWGLKAAQMSGICSSGDFGNFWADEGGSLDYLISINPIFFLESYFAKWMYVSRGFSSYISLYLEQGEILMPIWWGAKNSNAMSTN